MADARNHPADRRAQRPDARAEAGARASSPAPPGPASSTACAARSRRGRGGSTPTCRPRPAATRRRRHPACSAAAPWRAASPSASRAGRRACGVQIDAVEVEVEADFDARGELGVGEGVARRLQRGPLPRSRSTARHRRRSSTACSTRVERHSPYLDVFGRAMPLRRGRPPERPGGLTVMDAAPAAARPALRLGSGRCLLRAALAGPARAGARADARASRPCGRASSVLDVACGTGLVTLPGCGRGRRRRRGRRHRHLGRDGRGGATRRAAARPGPRALRARRRRGPAVRRIAASTSRCAASG